VLMIIISCVIDWFQVHEWHGLNTRSRAYQMSEGSGTKFKFLKFHRSFPGKNNLIQSNLLYKLVNFIWVFVVDEFDEWLTLSPRDLGIPSSILVKLFYNTFLSLLFLDVVYIYTFCYYLVMLFPLELGG
jgi:hypothetical protein